MLRGGGPGREHIDHFLPVIGAGERTADVREPRPTTPEHMARSTYPSHPKKGKHRLSTKAAFKPSMPEGQFDGARAADDRESDEEGVPGRFTTLRALVNLWRDRDVQYASLPKYLTDAQIECIRSNRLMEVNDLPVEDRGKAAMIALAWYPPEHGQGTR